MKVERAANRLLGDAAASGGGSEVHFVWFVMNFGFSRNRAQLRSLHSSAVEVWRRDAGCRRPLSAEHAVSATVSTVTWQYRPPVPRPSAGIGQVSAGVSVSVSGWYGVAATKPVFA